MKVVDHFANRASQREEQSYSTYRIHKKKSHKNELHEIIPEQYEGEREKPPTETFVLIGYIQEKQKGWVKEKRLYNTRFDEPVDVEKVSAKYLLLYDSYNGKANTKTSSIYRIIDNPEIWDIKKMLENGYPSPSRPEYFVYSIEPINDSWIDGIVWNISQLKGYKPGNASPFSVSLAELMQSDVK